MMDILRISVPITVWIAAFSAVYGLEGIVCSDLWTAAGLSLGQGRAALIASWAAAISLQVAMLVILRLPRCGSPLPWVQRLATILGFAALVATVWSLMPVATTSLCL
ncbi:hypothetical protein [uncultured Paracoccus sp.]|uniref:hypothetical protein n=1 Tax=uncultured Paracoccus sp. TaxID=189685 RepID=UPI002631470F|nr:hypothetical protein [uncultured Paracoccus sp.]